MTIPDPLPLRPVHDCERIGCLPIPDYYGLIGQAGDGFLSFSRHFSPSTEPLILIDHADPVIRLAAQDFTRLSLSLPYSPWLSLTLGPVTLPAPLAMGAVLRVQGSDRTVIYRVTACDKERGTFELRWPD